MVIAPFDIEPATGPEPLVQEVTYDAYQPTSGAAITVTAKNGEDAIAP
jgi:hypothetical protein